MVGRARYKTNNTGNAWINITTNSHFGKLDWHKHANALYKGNFNNTTNGSVSISSNPIPSITYPVNDSTVSGWSLIVAEDLSYEYDINSIRFEYSSDGTNWYLIGTEKDTIGDHIDAFEVLWDTSPVSAGAYQIRVNMTDNSGKWSTDKIIVNVNKQPVASSTASYAPTINPLMINFDASTSYDPDGSIVDYRWDFGDGNIAEVAVPTVAHDYIKAGTYNVMLKVTDNAGFEDWGYYLLSFGIPCQNFYYLIDNKCDCEDMTINTVGTAKYTGGNVKFGPVNTIDLSKPGPYILTYGFEIFTTLKAGSDPKFCSEQQWMKSTERWLNYTINKTKKGVTCGYDESSTGPWCDDGYKVAYDYKMHEDPVIRWFDSPGWWKYNRKLKYQVQESDYVWWYGSFKAEVKGQNSVCNCTWKIKMNVSGTGTVITPPQISDINCISVDPPIDSGGGGCPYVYPWNGSSYEMDNNLMPQSDNPNRTSLDVKDSYKLEKPLVQKNGKYYLLLKEFEQEHDYFDRVDLVSIDHDSSFKIAVDPEGTILTYNNPVQPVSAVDQNGTDVLGKIKSIDGNYYFGSEGDYIILNFGNVSAKEAKLVMKADYINFPVIVPKSIHAQIQVEENGKWYNISTILPRNYWATEIVDLTKYLQYLKNNFKVRLYFTKPHKLDFVSLDTSEQAKFDVRYANLTSATHSSAGDVKQKLLMSDGIYAELIPGQQIELVYVLPDKQKEVRDFILFSHGYYDKNEFPVTTTTTSTTTSTTTTKPTTTTTRITTTTRMTTTTASCTCTAWKSTGECCVDNKGKQIRTCTPKGCNVESRCYGYCVMIE